MTYWNQANFEGLLQLAEELRGQPVLEGLAEYAQLREKGLKKQAQQAIQTFLTEASACSVEQQRQLAARIIELKCRFREAHQWPGSLVISRFILPVLEAWDTPEGRRYRALQLGEIEPLEASLAEADHPELRRALIHKYLDCLGYAMHELGSGNLFGDLESSRHQLDRIDSLDPKIEAVPKIRQALNDWEEWQRVKSEVSFPRWCELRGRSHRW